MIRPAGVPRIRPHHFQHNHTILVLCDGAAIKGVFERLRHSGTSAAFDVCPQCLPGLPYLAVEATGSMPFREIA